MYLFLLSYIRCSHCIFFHSLILNLPVSLYLKDTCCKQPIAESQAFIQSDNICLFIGVITPFIFSIIVHTTEFKITILILFSICIIWVYSIFLLYCLFRFINCFLLFCFISSIDILAILHFFIFHLFLLGSLRLQWIYFINNTI